MCVRETDEFVRQERDRERERDGERECVERDRSVCESKREGERESMLAREIEDCVFFERDRE
jgi:hypothetical protein